MKSIFGAACAILVLGAMVPDAAWANPQHERMRKCNAEAREQALKGDARKTFMSSCLRGKHAMPAVEAEADAEAGVAESASAAVPAVSEAPAAKAPVADAKARRKLCNQEATAQSLKGAERKAFVAECVKA